MNQFDAFLAWERASRDTIDFKKVYVDMADDLVAGLVLSQIVYWYLPNSKGKSKLRIQKDDQWWIAKARHEWWDEIRISPKQLDNAVAKLLKRDLIVTAKYCFRKRPTVHIRLNTTKFMELWDECISTKGQNPHTPTISTKGQNAVLPNVEMDGDSISTKGEDHLTETTYTETTTETIKASAIEIAQPESDPIPEIESPEPSKQELEPTPPSSAAPPLPLLAPPGLRWIYRTDMTRHTVGANANQPTKTKCCNEPVGSYAGLVSNPLAYAECAAYTAKAQRSVTFSDEIKNAFAKLCKKDWRIKNHATQMNGALSQLSATGAVTIELLRRFYANWYKCDFRGQKQQAPSPHQVVDKWTEYTESDDCREETFNGSADTQQSASASSTAPTTPDNGREPSVLGQRSQVISKAEWGRYSEQSKRNRG